VQRVGRGKNQVLAMCLVVVEYRGLDDEGEETLSRRTRKIPVNLGYLTNKGARDIDFEDVEDALRLRKGETMQQARRRLRAIAAARRARIHRYFPHEGRGQCWTKSFENSEGERLSA